ncbi:PqqD family protein [[Bacillus] enclensis]|nr:PqqD family protein [[Bacillus] enclensis]
MKYQKNMFVRYRIVESQPYLVHKGEAFILDEVGVKVWELIDGINSGEEIIDKIAESYSVTSKEIKRDIEKYLRELQKGGLIEAS